MDDRISPFNSAVEGILLFLRNFQIVIPVYLLIFTGYMLVIAAILMIVPAEKIEEFGNYSISEQENIQREIAEELASYFIADIVRTASILLLFGLLVFVIHEFDTAGLCASSIEISKTGKASIGFFFEKGFLYTMKMVLIDLVGILIGFALISPVIAFSYFGFPSFALEYLLSIVLTILMLLLTFARFHIIKWDASLFESIAVGTRILIRHPLSAGVVFIVWFVISLPIVSSFLLFPPLIVLFPVVIALFYVMMGNLYMKLIVSEFSDVSE
jgi:hypothetical protein